MSHKHSCACEHEAVKYCKTCRIVHCEDCNQEWTAKGYYNPWYYNNGYLAQETITTGTADLSPKITWGDNQNILNDGHETLCKHETKT